jgi:hypothetical protein
MPTTAVAAIQGHFCQAPMSTSSSETKPDIEGRPSAAKKPSVVMPV